MRKIPLDLCTGCALCAHLCVHQSITMQEDCEGFLLPVVDMSKCTSCGACMENCPVLLDRSEDNTNTHQVFACQAKDQGLLIEATAGGLFPVAAKSILDQGGVVFGAAYDQKMRVVHKAATDMEGVFAFSGSKYVQSDISEALDAARRALLDERTVLFSGTPCQIDAVKQYCRDITTGTLYTIDVVCYGVPSPRLFRDYLDLVEKKHKMKVIDFRFRDKHKNGWGHTTVITFQTEEGESCSLEEADHTKIPYYKMFGYRDCYRKSCYQCKYNSLQRVSDITTGNFWGIEKISDTFDSTLGVSMAILNTEQGRRLFHAIQNQLIYESRSLEEAVTANDALVQGSRINKRREAIYRYYTSRGFLKMFRKYYASDRKREFLVFLGKVKKRIVKLLQGDKG